MSKWIGMNRHTIFLVSHIETRLITFILFVLAVLISHTAYSDEFDSALSQVQSGGSVKVIVTSEWQSITDNDPDWVSIGEMQNRILEAASKSGGSVEQVRRYRLFPVVSMTVDRSAIKSLQANNKKAEIWIDRPLEATLSKSAKMVGAPKFWSKGLTGKGQYVAVLDTGVDSRHPFLSGKVVSKLEACFSHTECQNGKLSAFGPGAGKPSSSHGNPQIHGTHVSGIIAGKNKKFRGISPDAKIVAVNVFSWVREVKKYLAYTSNIHAGIEYALSLKIDKGINIAAINMSLGGGFYSSPCENVNPYTKIFNEYAKMALANGMVIVAASGNSKNSQKYGIGLPACVGGIVSVGAIDHKFKITDFSQGASFLDIVAPGKNILSSVNSSKYKALAGTSMASPHVAGAVAILRQAKPNATGTELVAALKSSNRFVVDPFLKRNVKTHVLDLDAALRTIGFRVRSARPKSAQPKPAITKPAQAPATRRVRKRGPPQPSKIDSESESSGGWGAIK